MKGLIEAFKVLFIPDSWRTPKDLNKNDQVT